MRNAIWLVALAGCSLSSGIEVAPNHLDVSTLETSHVDGVYEMRALDADGASVGFVRLRTGTIAGLGQMLPGNDVGSEIVVSFHGEETRTVSHETQHFFLRANGPVRELLQLDEVATVLARDASISLPPRAVEVGYELDTYYCRSSELNQSPLARQCCMEDPDAGSMTTVFVNPSGQVSYRVKNPYHNGCKAMDGVSSCDGDSCFYGPNGYAKASLVTGSNAKVMTDYTPYTYGNYCTYDFYGSPQTPDFPDVTGSFPNGQGCPGGATGAGDWDY